MARRQPTVQSISVVQIKKTIEEVGTKLDAFKGAGVEDVTSILRGRAATIERTLATESIVSSMSKETIAGLEDSSAEVTRLSEAFTLVRGRLDDAAATPDKSTWLVEGTALDHSLKPITNVDVELFVREGARMRSLGRTKTDDEGDYVFDLSRELKQRRDQEIAATDAVVVISRSRKTIASRPVRLTPRGGARDRVDVLLRGKLENPPR